MARGRLKTNVLSNVVGYIISSLIAFVISPILILTLGDERYGIWALVAQLTGYYGLLDLGIRGAITYFTARSLAKSDSAGLRAALASGFWGLAGLGGVVLVLGCGVAALFPYMFKIGQTPVTEVRYAVLIMTVVIAVKFPMSALSGALVGYERLDIVNAIDLGPRILGAIAIYISMRHGGGLVTLAWIQAATAVISWTLTIYYLRKLHPELSLARSNVRRDALTDVLGYGSRSMTINVAVMVINRTDLVVIGAYLGTVWVTTYSIGQMLVVYLAAAASAITFSFTPRLTNLVAQNNRAELERVYLVGARIVASLVVPMAACMLAFGTAFISLWVGDQYVEGGFRERSDVVMALLIAATLPRILQHISWQLLFATRRQGFLARISVMEAVANIALSVYLVRHWGLLGVALGTLVPTLITHTVFLPRYVTTRCNVSMVRFLLQGIGRPAVVGVALYGVGASLVRFYPPSTWTVFVIDAAVTVVIGGLLLDAFAWQGQPRRAAIRALHRIRRALKPSKEEIRSPGRTGGR